MADPALSPILMDLLRCPCPTHATLTIVSSTADGSRTEQLVCDECQTAFPIRDGIPVMLMDEAIQQDSDGGPT